MACRTSDLWALGTWPRRHLGPKAGSNTGREGARRRDLGRTHSPQIKLRFSLKRSGSRREEFRLGREERLRRRGEACMSS